MLFRNTATLAIPSNVEISQRSGGKCGHGRVPTEEIVLRALVVIVSVVLPEAVPDTMVVGLNEGVAASGRPEDAKLIAFTVVPPVVLMLIVKLAELPAVTVTEAVAAVTEKSTPVPARVTACGLPGALSKMFKVAAFFKPTDMGWSFGVIVQFAPAASVAGVSGQVFVWLN
jgi:hypothetical protein